MGSIWNSTVRRLVVSDTVRTCDPWAALTLDTAAAYTMRLAEYIEGIGIYQAHGGISGISTEKCESLSLAACRGR